MANSPIDTSAPIPSPEPVKKKRKKTDFEKIGKDAKYPEVVTWIDSRIEFYKRYLPGGTPIESLTDEERKKRWDSAVVIIKELESFKRTVERMEPDDQVQP